MPRFPKQVQFHWNLSQAEATRRYIESGEEEVETAQSLTVALQTAEERQAALDLQAAGGYGLGGVQLNRIDPAAISYRVGRKYSNGYERVHDLTLTRLDDSYNRSVNDTPLEEADARALLLALAEAYREQRALGKVAHEEEKAKDAAHDAQQEAKERERAATEAVLKASREADRSTWIAAQGSDYLKRAVGAGYDCQRKYVEERVAKELPGFIIDFKDRAEWRTRSCPTEGALNRSLALKATGYNAGVVWLTGSAADGPDYGDAWLEFEPSEAIVISHYLGQYTLISQ